VKLHNIVAILSSLTFQGSDVFTRVRWCDTLVLISNC